MVDHHNPIMKLNLKRLITNMILNIAVDKQFVKIKQALCSPFFISYMLLEAFGAHGNNNILKMALFINTIRYIL